MSKTTWAVVDTSTQPIRDGEIVVGFTLHCMDTGRDYIVTVSGEGESPGVSFVNALRAAAQHIADSFSGPTPDAADIISTKRH